MFYQIKWIDYSEEYIEWIKERQEKFWNFDKSLMLKRKRKKNEQQNNH